MKEFKVMYKRRAKLMYSGRYALDKDGEEHWFTIAAPNGTPINRKANSRAEAEAMMNANIRGWAEKQASDNRSNDPPTEWRIMVREVSEWEVDE